MPAELELELLDEVVVVVVVVVEEYEEEAELLPVPTTLVSATVSGVEAYPLAAPAPVGHPVPA